MPTKGSKMLHFINFRMRVVITDRRELVGQLMAFDKHMNLVLGDCSEHRRIRSKTPAGDVEEKEDSRFLGGLVLLRGENVVSLQVESPPPPEAKRAAHQAGPGMGRPAGRGMPVGGASAAPAGLSGPVRGLGGPSSASMAPGGPGVASSAPPSHFGPPGSGRGMPPQGMGGPHGMPGMPPHHHGR